MKITIGDYLGLILKKKKISQSEFARMINNSGLTHIQIQNINNCIKGQVPIGTERARIFEIVLDLPEGTLTNIATSFNKNAIKQVNARAKELNLIK